MADRLDAALTVVREAGEHEIHYPAAALAYYGFVSLLPMVVLVLAVVGESAAGRIEAASPRFLTPEAQHLVYEAMTNASGRTGAALFAAAVLAWSGVNVAEGFLTVVERVEETPERSLVEKVPSAASVLASLGFAVVSVVLTSVLFTLIPVRTHVVGGGLVVLLLSLSLSFVPMYYVPSKAVTSVSATVPGSLTAAFGWTALLAGIQFYADHAGRYAVYGALSGVILILTSLYIASVALMAGVVVNATLAGR